MFFWVALGAAQRNALAREKFEKIPAESAAHRRERRKRTQARVLVSVAAAKETLNNHHSAQMAEKFWRWRPQTYAACQSCRGWRYHNQIAKDSEATCLCGAAWPKKDLEKAKAIALKRGSAQRSLPPEGADQQESQSSDNKRGATENQDGLQNAPWKKSRWTRAGNNGTNSAPENEVEETQGLIRHLRELAKKVAIPNLQLPEPDKENEIALKEAQPEPEEEEEEDDEQVPPGKLLENLQRRFNAKLATIRRRATTQKTLEKEVEEKELSLKIKKRSSKPPTRNLTKRTPRQTVCWRE